MSDFSIRFTLKESIDFQFFNSILLILKHCLTISYVSILYLDGKMALI